MGCRGGRVVLRCRKTQRAHPRAPTFYRNPLPEGQLSCAPRRLPHTQMCAKLQLQESLLQSAVVWHSINAADLGR